jgi:hypothetical protein
VGTLVCRQVDAGADPAAGDAVWAIRHCVIGPIEAAPVETATRHG